jgi:hypothetical protein
MSNKELSIRVLDLENIKAAYTNGVLNETYADAVGFWISSLLNATYGNRGVELPFALKGQKGDIKSLLHAIGMEKRYVNTAVSLGLTDPKTIRVKSSLESAIEAFEAKTGIIWPFKN